MSTDIQQQGVQTNSSEDGRLGVLSDNSQSMLRSPTVESSTVGTYCSANSDGTSSSSSPSPSDSVSNIGYDASSTAMINNAIEQAFPVKEQKEAIMRAAAAQPMLTSLMAGRLADSITGMAKPRNNRPHSLRNVGGVKETHKLQLAYPDFDMSNEFNINKLGHAYARDSRELDQRFIYEVLLKYSNSTCLGKSPFGKHYDVLVKDVGGYVPYHFSRGNTNVHVCNPVLDIQDQVRVAKTMLCYCAGLGEKIAKSSSGLRRAPEVVRKCLTSVCRHQAQHCTVRAPFVTFVHSSYNITVDELVSIMDRAEAVTAFGCFIFDPCVLFMQEGLIEDLNCRFRKFRDAAGVMYIEFSFVGDVQLSYIHKFDTYIALLRADVLLSRNSDNAYAVTCEYFTNHTLFFRLTRCTSNRLNSQVTIKYVPISSDDRYEYIHSWKFMTVPIRGIIDRIVPIRFRVPKVLLFKLQSCAMTVTATKFTVEHLRSVASAINNMEIISGTSVNVEQPVDPETLENCVVAVYFESMIRKWETGQLLQTLTTEEKDLRLFYEGGFFKKLWSKLKGSGHKTAAFSKTDEHPFGNTDTMDVDNCDDMDELIGKEGSKYWFSRLLTRLLSDVRYHPIVRLGGMVRLKYENMIAEHVQAMNEISLPFMHLPSIESCMLNHDAAVGMLKHSVPVINTITRRQPVNNGKYCDCNEGLQLIEVPGDGDCFFYSVILSLDLNLTVDELRLRLIASSYVATFNDSSLVVRRLNSRGYEGWADDDIIDLCAHEMGVTICVHMRDTPKVRKFNDHCEATVHLDYNNNHFSALMVMLDVDVRPIIIDMAADQLVEEAEEVLVPEYNSIIEPLLRTDLDRSIVRVDYAEASKRYHPLSLTGNFGYQSSYALLLNDLVSNDLIKLSTNDRVLDVNTNNGSSTQFYVDAVGCKVTAMCSRPVPVNVKGRFCSNMYSGTDPNDFKRYIGRMDDFDVVSINPPHYVDRLMTLDVDNYNKFLKDHFQSVGKLKKRGNMIICAPIYGDPRTFQLLTAMAKNFETYRVVRSGAVPPHNPWCILLLQGRRDNITVEPPEPLYDTLMTKIVRCISYAVMNSIYIDSHLAGAFSSISQITMQNLINATDSIKQLISSPSKSLSLPIKQYDMIKETLRVDHVRSKLCGGALGNTNRSVAFVVEEQPLEFMKFDRHYVKMRYPTLLSSCTGASFDTIAINYAKQFTRHHFDRLEELLGEVIVCSNLNELSLQKLRTSQLPEQPKRFYETFLVAAFYCHRMLNVEYVKLKLKREDLMRGCVVNTNHLVKPKNQAQVKQLFGNTSVGYIKSCADIEVDEKMVRTVADSIARHSLQPVSLNRTDEGRMHPKNTVELEETAPSDAVTGGCSDDSSMSRLKTLRDVAPAVIKEYENYCAAAVNVVVNNCGRAKSMIDAGHSDNILTKRLAELNDAVYLRRRKIVCGSRTLLMESRYVYVWNGSDNGKMLLKDNEMMLTNYDNVFCYEDMRILIECDMLSSFKMVKGVLPTTDIGIVQAAAGCGKTYSIITTAMNNRDRRLMILTSTKEGEEDVRSRLATAYGIRSTADIITDSVRTIDSYVVNRRSKVELLMIDEALMQHPGKLLMAINLSSADKIRLYGDALQIPFINLQRNLRLRFNSAVDLFPVLQVLYKSRRVPFDICQLLSELYEKSNSSFGFKVGMMSLSEYGKASPSFAIKGFVGIGDLPLPSVDVKWLCFTQAEKEELTRHGYRPSTIHEFQGKEADFVNLVRLDPKESNPTYQSMTHAVTALTRHKKFLNYYTAATTNDAVRTLLGKRIIAGGRMEGLSLVPNATEAGKTDAAVDAVTDLVNYNCLTDCQYLITYEPELQLSVFMPTLNSSDVMEPVSHIQLMIDTLLPGSSVNHNEHIQWMFNHNDFKIEVGALAYNNIGTTYIEPKYAKLKPLIRSGIHTEVMTTPRNVLNAIAKRNVNVPRLSCLVDIGAEINSMFGRFRRMCGYSKPTPVSISFNEIMDWFNDQEISSSDIQFDDSLLNYAIDNYDMILKANAKPELAKSTTVAYPQPQTILFQKKFVNAVFCTLWREISKRVCATLNKNLVIYTAMSPDQLSDEMTRRLTPNKAKYLNAIEFDMKKYDKSQGALILEFELQVMEFFGIPRHLITLWRNAHVHCKVTDRKTKIKFRTWFQRKSGDASTFFGNTLALIVMLTDIIDMDDIALGLFAGDDSVIYTHVDPAAVDTDALSFKYNLECKKYAYNNQYFCSKFLINYSDRWLIVPDPLKRGVKLGRRDLANFTHVEEYRKSLKDDTKLMCDMSIAMLVSNAMKERYMTQLNTTHAIISIHTLANDKQLFHSLFYKEPDDVICEDPSLRLLEL